MSVELIVVLGSPHTFSAFVIGSSDSDRLVLTVRKGISSNNNPLGKPKQLGRIKLPE